MSGDQKLYERRRVAIDCSKKPSLTEQHHKDAVDVNHLMARYLKTGTIEQRMADGQLYGDFTDVADYHTMINRMNDAQDDFLSLPASIRRRFGNDPGKLLEFVSKAENKQEAIELGLIPKAEPEPVSEPSEDNTEPVSDVDDKSA